jgi:hypothetical protein
VTSARRAARVAVRPVDDGGRVPRQLRRFDRRDWPDAADPFDAHRLWRQARREWAFRNGFAVDAPHGTRPGADWWAFLRLCEDESKLGA